MFQGNSLNKLVSNTSLKLTPIVTILPIVVLGIVGRYFDDRVTYNGFHLLPLLAPAVLISSFIILRKYGASFKLLFILSSISIILIYNFFLYVYFGINDFNNYSINKSLSLIFVQFPLLIVFSNTQTRELFFYILLGFLFILAFVGAANTIGGIKGERFAVLGFGPIVFARWMGVLIILSLQFLKKIKLIQVATIITATFLLFISGSKGPILAALITILVTSKISWGLITALTLGFSGLSTVLYDLIEKNNPRVAILFSLGLLLTSSSAIGRTERWSMALELFYNYPLGIGLGNYSIYSKLLTSNNFVNDEYAHNLFLELFSELGFVGVFISIVVLINIIRILFYRELPLYQKRLVLFLFLTSLYSGDIMDSRILFSLIFI